MELYLHSPIRLHGLVLIQKKWDKYLEIYFTTCYRDEAEVSASKPDEGILSEVFSKSFVMVKVRSKVLIVLELIQTRNKPKSLIRKTKTRRIITIIYFFLFISEA